MPVCVSYNDTTSKGPSPSILPVRVPEKHFQQMLLEWQKDAAAISAGKEWDSLWVTFWVLHLNSELATGTNQRMTSGKWETAWLLILIAFAVKYF